MNWLKSINTWSAGTVPSPTFVAVLGKLRRNHSVKPAIPIEGQRSSVETDLSRVTIQSNKRGRLSVEMILQLNFRIFPFRVAR